MLGFELDYLDLGTVSGSPGSFSGSAIRAKVTQKGEAAFAVIYLPVPVINLYLKAGVARLSSDLRGTFAATTCPPGVACFVLPSQSAFSTSAITPALGGGLQWTHGHWGIRAEYEAVYSLRRASRSGVGRRHLDVPLESSARTVASLPAREACLITADTQRASREMHRSLPRVLAIASTPAFSARPVKDPAAQVIPRSRAATPTREPAERGQALRLTVVRAGTSAGVYCRCDRHSNTCTPR